MKAYLPLVHQPLPGYKAEKLWQRIGKSAREHGYHSAVVFGFVRFKDHVLQQWAMRAAWNSTRIRCQRHRGVAIGKGVHWGTNVFIDPPYPYFVVVEDGASLAGNNTLLTHTKASAYHSRVVESFVAPIIVHKNAWVAVGVTILPGCEIGEGAIVSTGSVVTKDIPPLTMASGNPAKVVSDMARLLKKNYDAEEYERILTERKEKYHYN